MRKDLLLVCFCMFYALSRSFSKNSASLPSSACWLRPRQMPQVVLPSTENHKTYPSPNLTPTSKALLNSFQGWICQQPHCLVTVHGVNMACCLLQGTPVVFVGQLFGHENLHFIAALWPECLHFWLNTPSSFLDTT